MASWEHKGGITSWLAASSLPVPMVSPGHPCYAKLNALLDEASFDRFAETSVSRRAGHGTAESAAGSVLPLAAGWLLRRARLQAPDCVARRGLAGRAPVRPARPRHGGPGSLDDFANAAVIALEAHRAVFTWVQERLAAARLLKGRTVVIDATTLEANAAMRSIVRRDTARRTRRF
jgi:transposase